MIRVSGFILGVVLVMSALLLLINPGDTGRPGIRITSEPMEPIRDNVNPWLLAGEPDKGDTATGSDHDATAGSAVTAGHDMPTDVAAAPAVDAGGPEPGTGPLAQEPGHVADSAVTEGGRYLFWSPFRSAWAAEGFAGRLVIATSVPVEVVEEETGSYRVGFSYRDEMERRFRIERIESITGLQLE